MNAVGLTAPANPFGPSPARRPASIRRTSTLETEWPDGFGKSMRMRGRARDLITTPNGEARVLGEDAVDILATSAREILSIETCRGNAAAQALVGQRGGGYLRGEIERVLPDEHAQRTPLHLLLDDFSGASLVANWAWSQWMDPSARLRFLENRPQPGGGARKVVMEGVCWGFQPGSSALTSEGGPNLETQSNTRVPPLMRDDDPQGWHAFTDQAGVGMRRARRIDVWADGAIHVDVGFQDSATTREGGQRSAIHEYHVTATVDPRTFVLTSLNADPRILPYRECPGATANIQRMLGRDVRDFRHAVPETLPGTHGCTHLNDILRSMSDAPRLAEQLQAALGEPIA